MSEVVPEGWENLRLNEISKIKRGTTYVSSELSEDGSSFPLYINMKSFKVGGGYNKFGDKFYTPKYKKEQVLNANDILIANTDVTASCDILGAALCLPDDKLEKDVLFSHHVTALQLNSSVCKLFIFYLLCLGKYRVEMQSYGRGTTVKMLDSNKFGTIALNLPPLPEQKKIAAILTSVDDVIETTQEQINKLQDLKKATMNDLLTKGIGHTEFKDSELGRIPKSWEVKKLDDVTIRGSGHTPDKKIPNYWNGGIKWVSLADSSNLDNRLIVSTDKEISAEGIKNSSAVLHPDGTVILSRDAGIGKSAVLMGEMAVSQHFMAWRCGDKMEKWFLYYLLQSLKPLFDMVAIGSTIKTIGLGFFKKMQIVYPPIDEQRQISSIMLTIEDHIDEMKRKLIQTQSLKKSLMQDLLTGKVRVKVD